MSAPTRVPVTYGRVNADELVPTIRSLRLRCILCDAPGIATVVFTSEALPAGRVLNYGLCAAHAATFEDDGQLRLVERLIWDSLQPPESTN